MKFSTALSIAISCLALSPSQAPAATILSYDILNATLSGAGGWQHNYTGIITPTGGTYAYYSGGSGSLNDGVISTSADNNELFLSSPTLTFYLGGFTKIDTIEFLSNYTSNGLPGNLASVDLTLGGSTQSYVLNHFGPTGSFGGVDQALRLTGLQADAIVDRFTLSDFRTIGGNPETALGEISVNAATPAPEASTWAMLLLGFAGLGLAGAFRREKRAPTEV